MACCTSPAAPRASAAAPPPSRAPARPQVLAWRLGAAASSIPPTRRVQLVRRDGRDVSTLYGREGAASHGGGAGAQDGRCVKQCLNEVQSRLDFDRYRAFLSAAQ